MLRFAPRPAFMRSMQYTLFSEKHGYPPYAYYVRRVSDCYSSLRFAGGLREVVAPSLQSLLRSRCNADAAARRSVTLFVRFRTRRLLSLQACCTDGCRGQLSDRVVFWVAKRAKASQPLDRISTDPCCFGTSWLSVCRSCSRHD